MYVHFEGFPINSSALFELVSYLMTPVKVAKLGFGRSSFGWRFQGVSKQNRITFLDGRSQI